MNSSSNHWAFGFIYYLIVASYTTWMVKDVVSNIKAQNIPECHESTYAYWIASNIIFLALSTIWMVKEIPLNNFVRPGCTNQDQGNRLSWWGCIKTWTSWIYLCLLNSIKHPIFGFIYHLDGQRCSLKLKRSGYSKTWMSYIYICRLNTNKHNIFCFIYHLDGQRDTIKTVSDRPVCINTYMPWLYAFSCTMPEMRMHFW